MSRVLVACDDGSDRTDFACEQIAELGYTAIKRVEGGVNAYLLVDPLNDDDRKPEWRLVGGQVGVKVRARAGPLWVCASLFLVLQFMYLRFYRRILFNCPHLHSATVRL